MNFNFKLFGTNKNKKNTILNPKKTTSKTENINPLKNKNITKQLAPFSNPLKLCKTLFETNQQNSKLDNEGLKPLAEFLDILKNIPKRTPEKALDYYIQDSMIEAFKFYSISQGLKELLNKLNDKTVNIKDTEYNIFMVEPISKAIEKLDSKQTKENIETLITAIDNLSL